ncbi:MAG: transposase [Methylocella sp.]
MWTAKNRGRYGRGKLRYRGGLTDSKWELVKPHIPPGKRGGGKRTVAMREGVNRLMYVLSTGCQWRAIPKDLPPKSTISDYFDLWTYDGTLVVLPKRWLVERTFACSSFATPSSNFVCGSLWLTSLNCCRGLAKDWVNLNRKALAFLRLASIFRMLRRLCNPA